MSVSPRSGLSRETRLLLIVIVLSAAVLFALSRFRFPDREAAAIDAWYRSYLGRPAGEDGIRTWLDQHRQGMSLDQIQASILGSTEAFLQAGSSPPTWVKKSLSALGLRSDDGAVGYWLDRYHRNRGDMPQTALEMIRSGASADRAIRRFNRDDDD